MSAQAEQAIYDEFAKGDLKYLDAIERVQALGYAPEDAEAIVSEWADSLEPLDPMRGVDFPFAENH